MSAEQIFSKLIIRLRAFQSLSLLFPDMHMLIIRVICKMHNIDAFWNEQDLLNLSIAYKHIKVIGAPVVQFKNSFSTTNARKVFRQGDSTGGDKLRNYSLSLNVFEVLLEEWSQSNDFFLPLAETKKETY